MKMTNKCDLNRGESGQYFKMHTLGGFYTRWLATPEYENSQDVETSVCNYSLLRSASIDIQLASLGEADPINSALSKTHIKIYIYQLQESIFNVVHQVMVSLGYKKGKVKIYVLQWNNVLYFSPWESKL